MRHSFGVKEESMGQKANLWLPVFAGRYKLAFLLGKGFRLFNPESAKVTL